LFGWLIKGRTPALGITFQDRYRLTFLFPLKKKEKETRKEKSMSMHILLV